MNPQYMQQPYGGPPLGGYQQGPDPLHTQPGLHVGETNGLMQNIVGGYQGPVSAPRAHQGIPPPHHTNQMPPGLQQNNLQLHHQMPNSLPHHANTGPLGQNESQMPVPPGQNGQLQNNQPNPSQLQSRSAGPHLGGGPIGLNSPSHLATQMADLSVKGPQRASHLDHAGFQQQGGGMPQIQKQPPQQYPPSLNGGPEMHASPTSGQFVNGLPPAPGAPINRNYSNPPPHHGSVPAHSQQPQPHPPASALHQSQLGLPSYQGGPPLPSHGKQAPEGLYPAGSVARQMPPTQQQRMPHSAAPPGGPQQGFPPQGRMAPPQAGGSMGPPPTHPPGTTAPPPGGPQPYQPAGPQAYQNSHVQPPMTGQFPPQQDGYGGSHGPGGYPPQPGGGYPPQQQLPVAPGYGPQPPGVNAGYPPVGAGGYPPQPYYPAGAGAAQQAGSRRLDPDQMPSPIQVMQDDQRTKAGMLYTNQKGQVPPLVTTNFVVQDQGNASPRYIRSTMYNVPTTVDMMKQTCVPFGLVISPLARPMEGELTPPLVDMGELGPVRCIRCKAYMSPNMQFIDGGRRFHCLLCKATTEVPGEYFQHLDHTGQRVDRYERPELVLGAYEFIATKDYCRENTFPNVPAMVFLVDVSYNNVKSGLVELFCARIREVLSQLPCEQNQARSSMRVGFVTYSSTVHFYNVKACLAQPQMMVIGDMQEVFMPLLDGFLVDPEEAETAIGLLLEQIPTMFADTRETETVLEPAIRAGLEALKAAKCAGKLLVFHSSLPIAEAPGKLKNRDDRKLLGTEKEKSVLTPQNQSYNNLGQECVAAGVSVDLFVFNNSYIDLATIGQVCRLTGGEVYKYTYFQADLDGDRLMSDVKRNVSRPIGFDAIMRVRTSTGVRPTDFHGHFYMPNTTDMELGSVDCDKAVALEIKHDDKLTEEEGVYVQVALLYTSCGGQRRVRILNLALKACCQMADLYRACELDTIVNFFSKQAVVRLLEGTPKQVKEGLTNRCAQMLACYRKNCASPTSAGQLILPECMKLLPLYVNCLLKSDALSGGSDITIDDRTFSMLAVSVMDIPTSVVYFYPQLIPLHDIDPSSSEVPAPIRCSFEKLHDDGAYLLENGLHMFLWVGLSVAPDWVMAVFGVPSCAQIDTDRTSLPPLETPLSERIRALLETVCSQRHRSMRLTVLRPRDKMELVMKHFLVEDRGIDSSSSYVDFLCHMHKEIRTILS